MLARGGRAVAIADLDAAAAQEAAARTARRRVGLACDVADRDSVGAMAAAVIERLGAHRHPRGQRRHLSAAPSSRRSTGEPFDRVMAINVKGALYAMQACVPQMRARGYGRIVLTSSITGPLVGAPGHVGLRGVEGGDARNDAQPRARGLRRRRHDQRGPAGQRPHARVSSALGPELEREMIAAIPMRRLAEPEDVGWAVRFLASEEAGYITGQTLVLDGGQVLPEGMPLAARARCLHRTRAFGHALLAR